MVSIMRRSLILLYTSFVLFTSAVAAETFPEKTDAAVQDQDNVMDSSQVQQLGDIIVKLPEKYKIVIIPSTEELSTQEYATQLYEEYGMGQDEMLLVFNKQKEELGVKAGSFFSSKGLSDETIQDVTDHFFTPYVKQKSYMTGLSTVVQQFSETVQKGSAPAQASGTAATQEEKESGGSSSWLVTTLLILAGILTLGIYAYIQRRKLNREMDEIELWMDAIEEKLQNLKAEDESQADDKVHPGASLVEKIRKDSLPAAEFSLLEAESMCERFRFNKAARQIQQTKDLLAHIDHEIGQLQSKLFQNKIAEEECTRLLDEIKKTCTLVERKLDEARLHYGLTFYELREKHEQVANWLEAMPKEIESEPTLFLNQLKEKKQILIDSLNAVDRFPRLKQEVAVALEREISQLKEGIQEMLAHGYQIPQEQFNNHLEELGSELTQLRHMLDEGRIEGMTEKVNEVKEQIDSVYDLMEELVTKKGMVDHYMTEIPPILYTLDQERKQLKDELEELSLRYRVQEGAIFSYYLELQKVCKQAADQLFIAKQMDGGNDLELIQAADLLAAVQQEIEDLITLRDQAYEELEELRKGEFEAKDIVISLHAEIVRVEQQIRRENLPGVPLRLVEMIEEGKKSLFEIEVSLNEVPLELQRVNNLVKLASEFISQLVEYAGSVFKYSRLAEEKIQLSNRYRSTVKEVNELLTEAEQAFRNADYEQSYLLAEKAYEMAVAYSEGLSRLIRKKKA
ncbi:septation ring formation regulator EzrA [Ammoniphilus sp. 3BR4]|uniref:septation ring formation regulator EzrA n=1 Tax=Ammoniphilus sp. 3BR4 TaxID=3158265 RepID=UPI0034678546